MLFSPECFPLQSFNRLSHLVFAHQYQKVEPYRRWVNCVKERGQEDEQPVFLPIQVFKSAEVYDFENPPEVVFTSSGTTGTSPSRHFIASLAWYRQIVLEGFRRALGPPESFNYLFLLPGYLERPDSSLVHMAQFLHEASGNVYDPFFKKDYQALWDQLLKLAKKGKPLVLLGVTYALLEFVQSFHGLFPNMIIIETGGMKKQGPEVSKEELRNILREAFPKARIMSEYGMTELHSQAYATEDGLFKAPPWMRVWIQVPDDPFAPLSNQGEGRLMITDLANLHSCAFLATEDIGEVFPDGRFTVKGRLEAADLRGCHLLID